jgi:hypothetical protein
MPLVTPEPPAQWCWLSQAGVEWCFGPVDHPEPVDVPAIQRKYSTGVICGLNDCIELPPKKIWTCADRSRILLTAEDGTKHCIKLLGGK